MDSILGTANTRLGAPNNQLEVTFYKYSGLHPVAAGHEEDMYENAEGFIFG